MTNIEQYRLNKRTFCVQTDTLDKLLVYKEGEAAAVSTVILTRPTDEHLSLINRLFFDNAALQIDSDDDTIRWLEPLLHGMN